MTMQIDIGSRQQVMVSPVTWRSARVGSSSCSCLGELLVVDGLLSCLWGAVDRRDWTARLAAAGRAPITLPSLSPELKALPDLTETRMLSASSSGLQKLIVMHILALCDGSFRLAEC